MAGSPARLGVSFLSSTSLSRAQVIAAFRRASLNVHLPTDHRLLQTANEALMENDFRTAVIDSGTAAEVALGSAISTYLRKRNVKEEFIDQAVLNANGVVGLSTLYTSIITDLPISRKRIMNELARIRNAAAHGGKFPLGLKPKERSTMLARL